jgi:hypothetical protein
MKPQPGNLVKTAEYKYETKALFRGYNMRVLKIDLASLSILERR